MEFPSNSILGRCWDSSGPTERVKQLSSESRFIPLPGLIGRCCGESFLPHFVGDTPPPTISRLSATQRSPTNRGHFPLMRRGKLLRADDLRHLWAKESENATRRKGYPRPSARPRANSSTDRSLPAGTRPWPSSSPPTPTESPHTLHKTLDRLVRNSPTASSMFLRTLETVDREIPDHCPASA